MKPIGIYTQNVYVYSDMLMTEDQAHLLLLCCGKLLCKYNGERRHDFYLEIWDFICRKLG